VPVVVLTYDPNPYNFGNVPARTQPTTSGPITVRNDGNVRIRITGSNDTGLFTVETTQTTCVVNFELDPGQTCLVFMNVTKDEPGPANGTLTLNAAPASSGSPTLPFVLALSATAVGPPP
jgi:hypothetical protein